MYYFPKLDDTIRMIMISELENDLKEGLFYVPKSIKVDFVCAYKKLLKSTFEKGDVASLKRNLIPNFFKDRDKNGKKIPSNISETIAFSDFNRYYMRAILIRAINENKSVIIYRAKQSLNERAESKKLIGTCFFDKNTLKRMLNILQDYRLLFYSQSQLPFTQANSGLSLRF